MESNANSLSRRSFLSGTLAAFAGVLTEPLHAASKASVPKSPGQLASGFRGFDRNAGGMRHSSLTVLGARPGMGRTTYALQIVDHVARKQRLPEPRDRRSA